MGDQLLLEQRARCFAADHAYHDEALTSVRQHLSGFFAREIARLENQLYSKVHEMGIAIDSSMKEIARVMQKTVQMKEDRMLQHMNTEMLRIWKRIESGNVSRAHQDGHVRNALVTSPYASVCQDPIRPVENTETAKLFTDFQNLVWKRLDHVEEKLAKIQPSSFQQLEALAQFLHKHMKKIEEFQGASHQSVPQPDSGQHAHNPTLPAQSVNKGPVSSHARDCSPIADRNVCRALAENNDLLALDMLLWPANGGETLSVHRQKSDNIDGSGKRATVQIDKIVQIDKMTPILEQPVTDTTVTSKGVSGGSTGRKIDATSIAIERVLPVATKSHRSMSPRGGSSPKMPRRPFGTTETQLVTPDCTTCTASSLGYKASQGRSMREAVHNQPAPVCNKLQGTKSVEGRTLSRNGSLTNLAAHAVLQQPVAPALGSSDDGWSEITGTRPRSPSPPTATPTQ